MSDPPAEKSKGMKFAEQLMHNQGWKKGQGLGKKENGISEAIKVKIKCGKAGVGHDSAEQFTFHWWDHMFNKTASNIDVQIGQDGVKVSRLAEKDIEITNKKPQKGPGNRSMLYGRFIKSATLLSGGEKPSEKPSSSDSSDSSGDEEGKLDLSSAKMLTDEELVRACGGRTAHKGARHGLTMSAKLARLEEQEREFLAKYRKKDQKVVHSEMQQDDAQEELSFSENAVKRKKKKSKKSKESNACSVDSLEADNPAQERDSPKLMKKRKTKETDLTEVLEPKKSKKRDRAKEPIEIDCSETELQAELQKATKPKKEKKKKKKHSREPSEEPEEITMENNGKSKKKKKKRKLQEED